MKPLSTVVSPAVRGNQPTDGGNLIVEKKDYGEVVADPIAAKYLRPFRMGKELVRGLDRWCLWMEDDDFIPGDISKSPVLKERVQKCKAFREQASPSGDAYKLRETPHLMRQNFNRPRVPYVGIPAVVSETRRFYTAAHLGPEVIAGNKLFTAVDPDGLLFGLISSSMFITWGKRSAEDSNLTLISLTP